MICPTGQHEVVGTANRGSLIPCWNNKNPFDRDFFSKLVIWQGKGKVMTTKAREYIDFWIENSVHAAEQFRSPGGSQDVTELVQRLVEGAKGQGITEKALLSEVGDLGEYIRSKLATANQDERDRHK